MTDRKSEMRIRDFERRLSLLPRQSQHADDGGVLIALREALKAVKAGNFGVGACLFNRSGQLIARGHNSVFNPRFRSDQHAEMAVLDRAEKLGSKAGMACDFVLYTSLECCPMCLSRVILAGVGKVRYASQDLIGGMTEHRDLLPPVWKDLAAPQSFAMADCSSEHKALASDLFGYRLDDLNRRLVTRAGYRLRARKR